MAYIYEHIRTRGYEPLYFEEHFTYLEARAVSLLHISFKPSRKELLKAIKEALQSARFSPTAMNVVEVRYYADGELEVKAEAFIYNEFSLRALHPRAYLCQVSGDILLQNTSAKEALVEFNRTAGNGVAIWANEQNEVLAIDGFPVIAVFEDEVRFSRMGDSVEFNLAYSKVVEMGRNTTKEAISIEDLHQAKELLFVSHYGLSAVERYDTTRYMDITAEKLVAKIAEVEQA